MFIFILYLPPSTLDKFFNKKARITSLSIVFFKKLSACDLLSISRSDKFNNESSTTSCLGAYATGDMSAIINFEHRFGNIRANCIATFPPREWPNTDACFMSNLSSNLTTSFAMEVRSIVSL